MRNRKKILTVPGAEPVKQAGISGLYAITPDMADTDRLCNAVHQVLASGANLLQYRNKSAGKHLRLTQATALQRLCKQFQVPLIINDHLDLAMEIDAEGLHVGGNDISPGIARCHFGEDKIIGVSCYNQLDRAIEAENAGADYAAFGAFYPSMTKAVTCQAPIDLLVTARKQLSIPVVVIGGINPDNAGTLVAHGCHAVAVSNALFGAKNIRETSQEFTKLFNQF